MPDILQLNRKIGKLKPLRSNVPQSVSKREGRIPISPDMLRWPQDGRLHLNLNKSNKLLVRTAKICCNAIILYRKLKSGVSLMPILNNELECLELYMLKKQSLYSSRS